MQNASTNLNYKTIATATSDELRQLNIQSEMIQDAIAKIMSQHDFSDSQYSKELQSLDYLTQSLDALSTFWKSLSEKTPEDWSVKSTDFTGLVKLKDLADNLAGIKKPASPSLHEDVGFCDIF